MFHTRQCIVFDPGICLIGDLIASAMIRHTLGISIAPGTEIIDYADENEISRETKKSSEKEDSKKITRQGEGRKKIWQK